MLPIASISITIFFPLVYVLPLYISGSSLPRDHPQTIKKRIVTTAACCFFFSWVPTYLSLYSTAGVKGVQFNTVLELMGFRLEGLLPAVTLPLLLVTALFSGALAMDFLDSPQTFRELRWSPKTARNLIAAPLTEELCFRSGLVSYLILQGVGPERCIWLSPTLFGLAHLHHAIDLVKHHQWSPKQASIQCAVQFAYTMAFGWFAVFLFLRTGHYAAVVCTHAFCNFMGLPNFSAVAGHPRAKLLIFTYISGIAAFLMLLYPLTNPKLYGFVDNGKSNWGYLLFL